MDISFSDYNNKNDIHGTVLYPAPMIAPMQSAILKKLLNDSNEITVLDPFHGSGVALYEAKKISNSIKVIGYDINPFANLISQSKLAGVNQNIIDDINFIENTIKTSFEYKLHYFNNINKWFREDLIRDLSKIRHLIKCIDSKQNRQLLWIVFADTIRRYSNTRSSTYKLHMKPEEQILKMKNNAIRDFIQKAKKAYPFFLANFNNFYLKKCDSIKELTTLESNSIDVTITSPPYGDNKTTVPYGQFSTLALYWIDSSDLIMEGWELENYSIIDSNSMGGKRKIIKCNTLEHELFSKYTIGIGSKKKVKVENFLFDYLLFLKLVSRVTKNYIILTLGNRTVDKVKIDLTGITVEYLKYHGFNNENLMEREIPSKRIPSVTSSVDNSPVESMNSEYVLIFKKIADVNTSNY